MKQCPFCAESIQENAIKCRYCGSLLTEAAANPGGGGGDRTRQAFFAITEADAQRCEPGSVLQVKRTDRISATAREILTKKGVTIVRAPSTSYSGAPTNIVIQQAPQGPNRGIAALLSLVIPGAGHMYCGRVLSGLVWLVCVAVAYVLFFPLGILLHLGAIAAAAVSARPATVTNSAANAS